MGHRYLSVHGTHCSVPIAHGALKNKSTFIQLYCPKGISPMGNLGCLPQGKPAVTESHNLTNSACCMFQCFFNPSNSDMDNGIFNVRTDVNACNCGDVQTP